MNHIEEKREQDRSNLIHQWLYGQPRTFKNFMDTNSNQLRRQYQQKKLAYLNAFEEKERELSNFGYQCDHGHPQSSI